MKKFLAHLNDPKLNRMLEQGLDFSERKLMKRKETETEIEWQFRVKRSGELPAPIKKIINSDVFGWQETSRFVRKDNCIYWKIEPDTKVVKFHGEGVFKLEPKGKGCKRIIEGSVAVDIPLVGKVVENFIVKELVKIYEIEPSIQEKFYLSINDE